MTGVITFENVTFLIAMAGVAFGVYHMFRNPDIANDKAIALLQGELKNSKEISTLAIKTMQNDIHTVCGGIELMRIKITEMQTEVTKLGVIIEERIPKQ